ncbi:imidazole glycerol phosphate synthase, glutamine amidotransferase subunit with HisF [Flavobacterium sp. 9AF]|uniref:imidazole glycerol phosphate synthase subunit HisH n=1 Tax=Flavobacterium sp. 9AF TaxID=2653142 RepID=UPI0012F3C864|nr:imidazole glycerol phosphate synthase subunit HisH [Flavobacterium sp. 9AF]VXC42765.1 imidazole glycerol phosphate synthase, glutamine amidotransferase subunit with HisF [Flavobacterium sp. 9AF]
MKIAIIDYGAGNIQSILFALERIGFQSFVTKDWNQIKSADKVIFPGVGEASSAMEKLIESGLNVLIPTLKQPVLGICLGMQLLCKSSEEGNTKGLGIFDSEVIKFSNKVKVPQMGWNTIYNLKSELFSGISENEYMYLVHSFYVPKNDDAIALTDYETSYATALRKNNFYGVQFHPEKSGIYGEQILKNFLLLT